MANLNGFDASKVEPAGDFSPIPAGEYTAIIESSEMVDTKAGTGKFLKLVFKVAEGEYKGKSLFARLNLQNPNEVAVRIAKAELSSICRAVGVMTPKDSVELHNLPLILTVAIESRSDNGEPTNVIKGYHARGEAAAPEAQATTETPVWMR